jgi:hypothetical protein
VKKGSNSFGITLELMHLPESRTETCISLGAR